MNISIVTSFIVRKAAIVILQINMCSLIACKNVCTYRGRSVEMLVLGSCVFAVMTSPLISCSLSVVKQGAWALCVAACEFLSLQENILPSCTAVITAQWHTACCSHSERVKVSAGPPADPLTLLTTDQCHLSSLHMLFSTLLTAEDLEVQRLAGVLQRTVESFKNSLEHLKLLGDFMFLRQC